jgi:hypothetical protein
MIKLIVKHICGHYELHTIPDVQDQADDVTAAIAEAKLSRCECSDCKEG